MMQSSATDDEKPMPLADASVELSSTSDNVTKEEPPEQVVEQEKKSTKFKLTVLMICTMSVVVAMDSVIVAASLPAMAVALKGTSLKAFWVGTSYLLAQTVRN